MYCNNPNCHDNEIISDSVIYDSKNKRFYHNNRYCEAIGGWEVVLKSEGKIFIRDINTEVISMEKAIKLSKKKNIEKKV